MELNVSSHYKTNTVSSIRQTIFNNHMEIKCIGYIVAMHAGIGTQMRQSGWCYVRLAE